MYSKVVAQKLGLYVFNILVDRCNIIKQCQQNHQIRSHCGGVVTLVPPTSEIRVQILAWPQVGKLVVACPWSAVYSTNP